MDDFTHTDLLILQSAELTARTPFCPEDSEIAQYFDGCLAESRHPALEQHLADCRFCLARLGMLHRQQAGDANQQVAEEALAQAKQLRRAVSGRRRYHAPAWAAAAVIVIAVVTVLSSNPVWVPEYGVSPESVLPSHESENQLRSMDPSAAALEILSPAPGAFIAPGSAIRWNRIPGNTHYSISVLSQAGDLLWSEHLKNSEWIVPNELVLLTDGEIFFLVKAELPAGGELSSQHLVLRCCKRAMK